MGGISPQRLENKLAKPSTHEVKASMSYLVNDYLAPGMTVHTIIRSVAASGLSRTMSFFVIVDDKPLNITYHVANALGYNTILVNGYNAVRVSGGGMDMAFHMVSTLATVLFGDYKSLESRVL
jgi:hypothetical protein